MRRSEFCAWGVWGTQFLVKDPASAERAIAHGLPCASMILARFLRFHLNAPTTIDTAELLCEKQHRNTKNRAKRALLLWEE